MTNDRPRAGTALVESVQRHLRMEAAAAGRSVAQLARDLGVHRTTVSRALNQPTTDALKRLEVIADELGVDLAVVRRDDAGLPPEL